MSGLILIGLGGNLASPVYGPPPATFTAALAALGRAGVETVARSAWYRSAPLPPSPQPWYVNAVASVATTLDAPALLALMLDIEARLGRVRGLRNAARVIDLDLLDYRGENWATPALTLPHPRLAERRFVLEPLTELAPQWRHPILGLSAAQLLAALPDRQPVARMPD